LIHAGAPKTGSSSLQSFLFKNRPRLLHDGYLYPILEPGKKNHIRLRKSLKRGRLKKIEEWLTKQARYASEKGCHTVIISAETLFGITAIDETYSFSSRKHFIDTETALIKPLCSICEEVFDSVSFVFYLREQLSWAISYYATIAQVSTSYYGSLLDFIEDYPYVVDYDAIIKAWEQSLPEAKKIIRNYDACRGDVVSDFVRNVMDESNAELRDSANYQLNVKPSFEYVAMRRVLNARRQQKATKVVLADEITKTLDKNPALPRSLLVRDGNARKDLYTWRIQLQAGNEAIWERCRLDQEPLTVGSIETVEEWEDDAALLRGIGLGIELGKIESRWRTKPKICAKAVSLWLRSKSVWVSNLLDYGGALYRSWKRVGRCPRP